MQSVVFQTPVPTAGSEMWGAVAVLFWIIAVLLLSRRLSRIWRYFGDVVSFLLFFLGLLFLEILMF